MFQLEHKQKNDHAGRFFVLSNFNNKLPAMLGDNYNFNNQLNYIKK